MIDIFLLAMVGVIGWQFWSIRGITESAKSAIAGYCQQQKLQLLSISRHKIQPHTGPRGLQWKTVYNFEFTSTGESVYIGQLTMHGTQAVSYDLPAYRI